MSITKTSSAAVGYVEYSADGSPWLDVTSAGKPDSTSAPMVSPPCPPMSEKDARQQLEEAGSQAYVARDARNKARSVADYERKRLDMWNLMRADHLATGSAGWSESNYQAVKASAGQAAAALTAAEEAYAQAMAAQNEAQARLDAILPLPLPPAPVPAPTTHAGPVFGGGGVPSASPVELNDMAKAAIAILGGTAATSATSFGGSAPGPSAPVAPAPVTHSGPVFGGSAPAAPAPAPVTPRGPVFGGSAPAAPAPAPATHAGPVFGGGGVPPSAPVAPAPVPTPAPYVPPPPSPAQLAAQAKVDALISQHTMQTTALASAMSAEAFAKTSMYRWNTMRDEHRAAHGSLDASTGWSESDYQSILATAARTQAEAEKANILRNTTLYDLRAAQAELRALEPPPVYASGVVFGGGGLPSTVRAEPDAATKKILAILGDGRPEPYKEPTAAPAPVTHKGPVFGGGGVPSAGPVELNDLAKAAIAILGGTPAAISAASPSAAGARTPVLNIPPRERPQKQWDDIKAVWGDRQDEPALLMDLMRQFGFDAADLAYATGQSVADVGRYLIRNGADDGFAGWSATRGYEGTGRISAPAGLSAPILSTPPRERPQKQWDDIKAVWDDRQDEPALLMDLMRQFGFDAADLAYATGQSVADVGSYLIRNGAADGFAGWSATRGYEGTGRVLAAHSVVEKARQEMMLALENPLNQKLLAYYDAHIEHLQSRWAANGGVLVEGGLRSLQPPSPAQLPDNEQGRFMTERYGVELATQLYRLDLAMRQVRDSYAQAAGDALRQARDNYLRAHAFSSDRDEGPPAHWGFSLSAFTDQYLQQDSQAAQLFKALYSYDAGLELNKGVNALTDALMGSLKSEHGEKVGTSDITALSYNSYREGGVQGETIHRQYVGQGQFELHLLGEVSYGPNGDRTRWGGVSIDDSGISGLVRIDLARPPKMHDAGQVFFDPKMGWVTTSENVDSAEFADKAFPILVAAAAAYFGGPYLAQAAGFGGNAVAIAAFGAASATAVTGLAVNGRIDFGDVIKSALTAAFTAGITNTLGLDTMGTALGPGGVRVVTDWGQRLLGAAGQVTLSGFAAELRGANFADGIKGGIASVVAQEIVRGLDIKIGELGELSAAARSQMGIATQALGSAIKAALTDGDPLQAMAIEYLQGLGLNIGDDINAAKVQQTALSGMDHEYGIYGQQDGDISAAQDRSALNTANQKSDPDYYAPSYSLWPDETDAETARLGRYDPITDPLRALAPAPAPAAPVPATYAGPVFGGSATRPPVVDLTTPLRPAPAPAVPVPATYAGPVFGASATRPPVVDPRDDAPTVPDDVVAPAYRPSENYGDLYVAPAAYQTADNLAKRGPGSLQVGDTNGRTYDQISRRDVATELGITDLSKVPENLVIARTRQFMAANPDIAPNKLDAGMNIVRPDWDAPAAPMEAYMNSVAQTTAARLAELRAADSAMQHLLFGDDATRREQIAADFTAGKAYQQRMENAPSIPSEVDPRVAWKNSVEEPLSNLGHAAVLAEHTLPNVKFIPYVGKIANVGEETAFVMRTPPELYPNALAATTINYAADAGATWLGFQGGALVGSFFGPAAPVAVPVLGVLGAFGAHYGYDSTIKIDVRELITGVREPN